MRVSEPGAQCAPAAGDKGSSYAFHAPGGKLALSGQVPVLGVDVVDTTGAGDAYLAGGRGGGGRGGGSTLFGACLGLPESVLWGGASEERCRRVPPASVAQRGTCAAGFLFYMLLAGGLQSLVADPAKVRLAD